MILKAKNLIKTYNQGSSKIEILKGLNLDVIEGETVSIVGPSGGGKSTLLALLSGVDRPTQGEVLVLGQNIFSMDEDALTEFRGKNYGIVFQQFHLISHLTAIENVMLPLEILGESGALDRARNALKEVGLSHRLEHKPSELSGGEAQRVAIARALVTEPRILLADEPSGNLDVKTGEQVMGLLFDLVAKYKTSLVLVTHSLELAARCKRQLEIVNGQLKEG
jgi:putative ABC transport system ATP-binding protein